MDKIVKSMEGMTASAAKSMEGVTNASSATRDKMTKSMEGMTSSMSSLFGKKKKASDAQEGEAAFNVVRVVDAAEKNQSELAAEAETSRLEAEAQEAFIRAQAEQQAGQWLAQMEKRERLCRLAASDPDVWKVVDMKAALRADDVNIDAVLEKTELQLLTVELVQNSPLLKAEADAAAKAAAWLEAKEEAARNAGDAAYSARLARARKARSTNVTAVSSAAPLPPSTAAGASALPAVVSADPVAGADMQPLEPSPQPLAAGEATEPAEVS